MDIALAAPASFRASIALDTSFELSRLAISLSDLLPLVEAAGDQSQQLSRELTSLAATRSTVYLVQPTGIGPAHIDTGLHQFAIPQSLRSSIIELLGKESAASSAVPARSTVVVTSDSTELSTAARALSASPDLAPGVNVLAEPGLATIVRDAARHAFADSEPPTLKIGGAILDAAVDSAKGAMQLRQNVETSGLFFESHLQHWASGERSLKDVRDELARMPDFATVTRADDMVSAWTSPVPGGAERVAAQLEALQSQSMALQTQAWQGQPMRLEIERDRNARDDAGAGADAHEMFGATLTLELPRLGKVVVSLRLAGNALAMKIRAPQADSLRDALPAFAEQLQARGLQPAGLQALSEPT